MWTWYTGQDFMPWIHRLNEHYKNIIAIILNNTPIPSTTKKSYNVICVLLL